MDKYLQKCYIKDIKLNDSFPKFPKTDENLGLFSYIKFVIKCINVWYN
jgi:hypothetical protein